MQGAEPEHEAGREQTLFDRLMKMVSLPGWRKNNLQAEHIYKSPVSVTQQYQSKNSAWAYQ